MSKEVDSKEIVLKLDGELGERGSIDYRTLFGVVEGTVGVIEGFARVLNANQVIDYRLSPARKGSFEISLQTAQDIGALTLPLIGSPITIKNVISWSLEYIKILKALKGEKITKENTQITNDGNLIIKNNNGEVIYNDNRVTNVYILGKASEDAQINKKISKISEAIERNKDVEIFSLIDPEEKEASLQVNREDAKYLKYEVKIEEKPDQLVGYVRSINNKTTKGIISVLEGEKERGIDFELDIRDINLLDKVVTNLALAEANKSRVVMTGEKIFQEGKLKKVIVTDIDIPDKPFDF